MEANLKRKCFAAKDGACYILIGQTTCTGCRFYKTTEQLAKERTEVKKRLAKINPIYATTI